MGGKMDFFNVVETRQSIRAFKPDKIDSGTITQLLEAIRTSPTAGNLQAYQVYLVESPAMITALFGAAYNQRCIWQAPVLLVFCADAPRSASKYRERGTTLYCIQDATIAATIAHLAATALNLGSVMVGSFNEKQVADIIGAPASQRPVVMMPIGYANETPGRTDRRPVDDLVIRL